MPLYCHGATPAPQAVTLEVEVRSADQGALAVVYRCRCPAGQLRIPAASAPRQTDELWRHTCCELFVGRRGDAAYREFNWSPSGAWAAYAFSDYRARTEGVFAPKWAAPALRFASGAGGWTLQACVDALALPPGAHGDLEFGPAAVLESSEGVLSYWALQHAAERPDFHRREAFVLRL